ncbi:MAG TPA: DNA repair protein RecN [Acidimicrobiales bacterium]|nr:DNA repair protein RecN [Acidimicrobiales bacterium]
MLAELAVENLGVIDRLQLVLGPGMTALTGETGAGKTLLVEAVDLLVGGRADPVLVGPAGEEAIVEGRFVSGHDEIVLRRVIPSDGRSRAYVDGRLATASALSEAGKLLVDLHGQHAHQSLLQGPAQRAALDRFGDIDLSGLEAARAELREIEVALADLGGDDRARARELDLLRFQVAEIDAAAITGPDEDQELEAEGDRLGDAVAHREAAEGAADLLLGDDAARDRLAAAGATLADRAPFKDLAGRLVGLQADLEDVAAALRDAAETIEPDPERLAVVRERRHLLSELRRKYGDTLGEVLEFRAETAARLSELESHEERAAALDERRARAEKVLGEAAAKVGRARRAAAPALADAAVTRLQELAMPNARLAIDVGADPGDDVTIQFSANPGSAPQPLAKVASGGELARTMLALRLVTTEAPPTLVFDEVDAGIGGTTALALAAALAELGDEHQVLVVTHLPQVAAFADAQVTIEKQVTGERTATQARPVDGDARIVELSRMLSGQPDSATARQHADELLGEAAARRAIR